MMSGETKVQLRVSEDDLERWDEFVDESMLVSSRSEMIRRAVGVYIQENTHLSVEGGIQVNDSANKLEQDVEEDIREALDLLDYISEQVTTIERQTKRIDDLASEDELADIEQSIRLAINNTTNGNNRTNE